MSDFDSIREAYESDVQPEVILVCPVGVEAVEEKSILDLAHIAFSPMPAPFAEVPTVFWQDHQFAGIPAIRGFVAFYEVYRNPAAAN